MCISTDSGLYNSSRESRGPWSQHCTESAHTLDSEAPQLSAHVCPKPWLCDLSVGICPLVPGSVAIPWMPMHQTPVPTPPQVYLWTSPGAKRESLSHEISFGRKRDFGGPQQSLSQVQSPPRHCWHLLPWLLWTPAIFTKTDLIWCSCAETRQLHTPRYTITAPHIHLYLKTLPSQALGGRVFSGFLVYNIAKTKIAHSFYSSQQSSHHTEWNCVY